MAEDPITLNGKLLHEHRVVDLKKECEKRDLSKTGNKAELIERLSIYLAAERYQGLTTGDDEARDQGQDSPAKGEGTPAEKTSPITPSHTPTAMGDMGRGDKKRISRIEAPNDSENDSTTTDVHKKNGSPEVLHSPEEDPIAEEHIPLKKRALRNENINQDSTQIQNAKINEEEKSNTDMEKSNETTRSEANVPQMDIADIPMPGSTQSNSVTDNKEQSTAKTEEANKTAEPAAMETQTEEKEEKSYEKGHSRSRSKSRSRSRSSSRSSSGSRSRERKVKKKRHSSSESESRSRSRSREKQPVVVSSRIRRRSPSTSSSSDGSRSRSRQRSSSRSSERRRSRSRSYDEGQTRHYSKEKGKSNDRSRSRSASMERSRSRSKEKHKSRSASPRPKSRSRSRSSSRESRSKSSGKKERSRSRSKSPSDKRQSESRCRSSSPVVSSESQAAQIEDSSFFTAPEDTPVRAEKTDSQLKDGEEADTTGMEVDVSVSEKEEGELAADSSTEVKAPTPKFTRKISLSRSRTSTDKQEEVDNKENQSGVETEKPARKRKWGSKTSTATAKPPRKATSMAISTDSLKGLMPEIKTNIKLETADLEKEAEEEAEDDTALSSDKEDKRDVKIRRTVLQVVKKEADSGQEETEDKEMASDKGDNSESESESGEESEKEEEEVVEKTEEIKKEVTDVKQKAEPKIVRRLNHQAILMEVDEPQATGRSASPARNPVSKIVQIRNLVRPFTLPQLKELLKRTGTLNEENFWVDKIKSRCYATYSTEDEAMATREALHGTRWPQSNPKILSVEYATQEEVDRYKEKDAPPAAVKKLKEKEREREAERRRKEREERHKEKEEREKNREREQKKRDIKEPIRAPPIREWDRDKIQQRSRSPEGDRSRRRSARSRSRDKQRDRSRERADRREKKEKKGDEPPAKLLDDLFRKTKTTPCIYWLPLTEEQIKAKTDRIHFPIRISKEEVNSSAKEKERLRAEREKEREMRIKERQEREENRRGRTSPIRVGRDRDRGPRDSKMSEDSPEKARSRTTDSKGRQRPDRSRSSGRRR